MNNHKKQNPPTEKPSSAANISSCFGRQHTKLVLQDKIKKLEIEINSLKTLIDTIDWNSLTNEQESYLWDYFIKNR